MSAWAEKPVKLRAISRRDLRTLQITVPAHLVREAQLLDGELFRPELTPGGDLLFRRLTRSGRPK